MKNRRAVRLLIATAACAVVLTACGASAPPGKELADEMIDTAERNGQPLSDDVKNCMHEVVDGFRLTEDEAQGFDNFDEVADKAADGQEQALRIMQRFEDELAGCNTAG